MANETVLIIDDEADQASLNSYGRSNSKKNEDKKVEDKTSTKHKEQEKANASEESSPVVKPQETAPAEPSSTPTVPSQPTPES